MPNPMILPWTVAIIVTALAGALVIRWLKAERQLQSRFFRRGVSMLLQIIQLILLTAAAVLAVYAFIIIYASCEYGIKK